MNFWKNIRQFGNRHLTKDGPATVDLSEIDAELAPPRRTARSQSVAPPQNHEPIEVLTEYKRILELVQSKSHLIFVSGRAGTGKSTLIRFLTHQVKNCAVLAPTAMAASNVNGSTVHSFFNIPPRTINPEEVFDPRRMIGPVIGALEVLIIDEISMVTPDIIDCISNSLQKARRSSLPFGGVSVVFVGDLLQLPPVVRDPEVAKYYSDRYNSPFFYSADVFHQKGLVPVELTRVFRQTDQEFIELLDQIRTNNNHEAAIEKINRECYHPDDSNRKFSLVLVPTIAAAQNINTLNLNRLNAPLTVFEAIVEGGLNTESDRFQAPYRLEVKEGAQIVFVKNNKPNWMNGTQGRIVQIKDGRIHVEIKGTGNRVIVDRATWEKVEYSYDDKEQKIITNVVGSFKQFPFALGWAITIHKSQGMTLDSAYIDFGEGAFCSGQAYVALSRCRSLEGISLARKITEKDVKADQTILKFYQLLRQRIESSSRAT